MKGAQGSSGGWQSLGAPQRVGPYRILRELGRGCFGVVYQVERDGLPRQFALKVLIGAALRNQEAVARFEREARLASRVQDPGVVGVHDIGHEGRYPYYVMDLVEGETLDERIRRGALPPEEAARTVAMLARTMASAHAVGVLHRDLKPANVILDRRSGRPRITDFGLAQEEGGMRLTQTGEAVGTPFYMAPEQNLGQRDLDARVDVYALGVILYQCLTQAVPFQGANFVEISQAIRAGNARPPRSLEPAIPAELEEICLKAMAREREERHPGAAELAVELEGFLRASGASTEGLGPPDAARAPLLVIGALALALVALAGAGLAWLYARTKRFSQELAAARAGGDEAEARLERARELAVTRSQREAVERLDEEREQEQAERARLARERERRLETAQGDELRQALGGLGPEGLQRSAPRRRARAAALVREAEGLADAREVAPLLRDAELLAQGLDLELELARARARQRALQEVARAPARSGEPIEQQQRELRAVLAELDRFPALARGAEAANLATQLVVVQLRERAPRGASLPELLALIDAQQERAAAYPPVLGALRVLRAETCRRRGAFARALAETEGWRDAPSPELAARALYIRAWSLLRLERGEESARAFLELRRLYPDTIFGLASAPSGTAQEAAAALDALARARQRAPGEIVDLPLTQAWTCMKLGRWDEVERYLAEARALAPDHARVALVEGFMLTERDPRRSHEVFQELCRRAAEPIPQALRQLALGGWRLGRKAEALEAMDQLVRALPGEVEPLVLRGVLRRGAGQEEPATADLRAALARGRDQAYAAARRYGNEAAQLLQLAEQGGATAAPLPEPPPAPSGQDPLAQAWRLARAGKPPSEVFPLLDAAARAGNAAAAQLERADLLARRARYAESSKLALELARGAGPLARRARYVHAFNQLWQNRWPEGSQELSALAREDPNDAVGKLAQADLLSFNMDNVQGERLAREAVGLDPSWIETYLGLCFTLSDQGKRAEALELAAKLEPVAKDHPRLVLCVASAYQALGRKDEAVAAFKRLLEMTGPTPPLYALHKFASLAFSLGRPQDCRKTCDLILAQTPQDLRHRWLRGVAFSYLNQEAEAVADWQECRRQNAQATQQLLASTQRVAPEAFAKARQALGQ